MRRYKLYKEATLDYKRPLYKLTLPLWFDSVMPTVLFILILILFVFLIIEYALHELMTSKTVLL